MIVQGSSSDPAYNAATRVLIIFLLSEETQYGSLLLANVIARFHLSPEKILEFLCDDAERFQLYVKNHGRSYRSKSCAGLNAACARHALPEIWDSKSDAPSSLRLRGLDKLAV